MKKILAVNDYGHSYANFWANLEGEIVVDPKEFMETPKDFDLVCFTGGEDVSPELYGHKNLHSGSNRYRDEAEILVLQMAERHGIPMTGICRGSQFLNVMCGGTMVQHIRSGHQKNCHRCFTFDGQAFEVTSSHHQMVVPGDGGVVLAWAEQGIGIEDCVYDGELPEIVLDQNIETIKEDGEPMVRVTEAFCYPEAKVFAVQHHPEWQAVDCEAAQWTLRMIREICLGQKTALSAQTF